MQGIMRAISKLRRACVAIVFTAVLGCESAMAAITGLQRVASGVTAPIFATHAPGDTSRLFILERAGGIRILDLNTGVLQPTPFFTVPNVSTGGEGGLLGMAFHPDYFNSGTDGFRKFYVNLTTDSTTFTRIREYQVSPSNPNAVNTDPMTQRQLMVFSQPQNNHNGGWIGFSPNNKYLYIASGDGGGSNDSGTGHAGDGSGNAQDVTNNMLGKMLRIDPIGDDFPSDANRNYSIPPTNPFKAGVGIPGDDGGDDEIWGFGLRNPFRASFDRITGDLWIGDVGQGAREEIDFEPAATSGGLNYGWRFREGTIATPSGGVGGACAGCVEPVYEYERPTGNPTTDLYRGTVVTGGYRYRGPDPSLQGKYFFLDSRNDGTVSNDNYWHFDPANPGGTVLNINTLLTPDVGSRQFPVSFGEDAKGNLYITYAQSGEVYRIRTNQVIPGDANADGEVDELDFDAWAAAFGTSGAGLPADANGNGVVDAADYVIVRNNQGTSVHAAAAGALTGAIPEPATAAIIAPVILLLAAVTRRRR